MEVDCSGYHKVGRQRKGTDNDQLNDIYNRLDGIAANWASVRSSGPGKGAKAGHVAPSHRRFTLATEIARKGKVPRHQGDAWMWATGHVGLWPGQTPPPDTLQAENDAEGSHSPQVIGQGSASSAFEGMDVDGLNARDELDGVGEVDDEWRQGQTGALVSALEGISG